MAAGTNEANFAVALSDYESDHLDELNKRWWWSGWKYRLWPADVDWTNRLVYAFDKRERRFVALLRITNYASFEYHTKQEFKATVSRRCGWVPDLDGDAHGRGMPFRRLGKPLVGFAVRWRFEREVDRGFSIPRFPQVGWLKLDESPIAYATIDAADLYEDGGIVVRQHRQYERNPKLRQDARQYWRKKMGGSLRCWVCRFDFGEAYGKKLGDGFIEMHHEQWLSLHPTRAQRRVIDLVPVCSNCHRMIHRRPELRMSARKLKERVAHNRKADRSDF
jgi:hypothetical protein